MSTYNCSIFISGFSATWNGSQVRKICQPFGEIFSAKVVRPKSNPEHPFAIVTFMTAKGVSEAIAQIDGAIVKEGPIKRRLSAKVSQPKKKLVSSSISDIASSAASTQMSENGDEEEKVPSGSIISWTQAKPTNVASSDKAFTEQANLVLSLLSFGDLTTEFKNSALAPFATRYIAALVKSE